jgi:GNAT superfamily N-acetyltransferase
MRRAGRRRSPTAPPRGSSAVELRPASELSRPGLAELFTAAYEGYQFPVHLDEAAFSTMADLSDFDLDLSRIAFGDGRPLGLGLIGVRGRDGWIGGLGVVASERRHGLGRALMESVLDAARHASIMRITLEVLEPNVAAIALYEQLGFELTRMLEVWSLHLELSPSTAESTDVARAADWIRANRSRPEPWQRADESVANLLRGGTELEAVMVPDRGAALFRVSDGVASVLQLAARDEDAASQLLDAVRLRGQSLRYVNVPEGDPAAGGLGKLGGTLDVRQLEMALELEP